MGYAAPGLLVLSCLGAGALFLSVTRLLSGRPYIEKLALSFAVGFGLVGWLFFWLGTLGLYSQTTSWIICSVLAMGLHPLRRHLIPNISLKPFSALEWLLLVLIAAVMATDFLEALAPPVEADSLAYHFQLPKQFFEQGRLVFEPRALDGAIPLLVQMTYLATLLLGGGEDIALTLWAFVSGWGAGLLLFTFSRRWLARHWSLALLVLFQTLPAMLYGAGSGHIEPRMAMFVLIAAIGFSELKDNPRLGPILLIGLGAGLFAASKYTGLLFVAAAGLSVLAFSGRDLLKNGTVFGLVVLAVGSQWYGWNTWHTGDPVFPILFTILGLEDGVFWDADYAASMKDYLAFRSDQINWWQRWLAYPVAATLFPARAMEAGRVGLGPYFLMIAPMALAGVWHARQRVKASPLARVAVMAVLFYVLWLGFGGIPKVRHLIPIVPVVLVLLGVGTVKAIEAWPTLRIPSGLAMVLALAVNFAIIGIFARPYVSHAVGGFERERFLERNINGYPAVAWLNEQDGIDKVLLTYRAFRFYVRHETFLPFPRVQKLIEARPERVDTRMFWKQMRGLGISHILTDRPASMSEGPASVDSAIQQLVGDGCLVRLYEIETPWRTSRTLPSFQPATRWLDIWRLNIETCPFDK